MPIHIDQSGKVENTEKDTILALSNGVKASIKLSGKNKRLLQRYFRLNKAPRLFIPATFSILVYFLIESSLLKRGEIIIDIEYPGQELKILQLISSLLGNNHQFNLSFGLVGKRSPAHFLAIKTARKEIGPNVVLTVEKVVCLSRKLLKQ